MNLTWRVIEFAAVSGFVVALALALCSTIVYPFFEHRLRALPAQARARVAFWWLSGPAAFGTLYASAILISGAALQTLPMLQVSCARHEGSWWHACLWHPMDRAEDAWLWIALLAIVAALVSIACQSVLGLWRGQRNLRALIALSRRGQSAGDVVVVDSMVPLALAVGVAPGHVLLSRGLTEALSPEQLQAVIAHERAHLRRGDVMVQLVARVAAMIHLPALRSRLLDHLVLAAEQRCDAEAAKEVGSALLVAETLLAVERLHESLAPRHRPWFAVAFADSFLVERVHALLRPGGQARAAFGVWLCAGAGAVVVLSAGWVHHLTEFLVLLTTS